MLRSNASDCNVVPRVTRESVEARVAAAVAIATFALGVSVWLTGASVWFAVIGVLGAAFMYLIMRSHVELVRVIVDMLLPK